MHTDEQEVYQRCIEKWGVAPQVTQAMGECGELIAELNRFFFQGRGEQSLCDVIDEIADVQIMCGQLSLIVGKEHVESRREFKLDAIRCKLEGGDQDGS